METRTIGTACAGALLALVLVAGASQRADAGALTYGGTADGTIDGVPFSSTPFTAVATYRWSADLDPSFVPIAAYPAISLSFDIAGQGTYTSAPGSVLFAVLLQPAYTGSYGAYFEDGAGVIFGGFFATGTWQSATQTLLLSDPNDPLINTPFTVPLAGGGSLVINDFYSLDSTASILAPEPATLGLFGLGLGITGLLRNRSRRRTA